MAARPRKPHRRELPPYLYARRDRRTGTVYYSYRAADGHEHGLGTNREAAIEQAIEANRQRLRPKRAPLVERITAGSTLLMSAWIDTYAQRLEQRFEAGELRRATLTDTVQLLRRTSAVMGHLPLATISTRDVADWMRWFTDQGKARMAQRVRSTLRECLREAIADGLISANPVDPTRAPRARVQRNRLTLDQFRAIYAAAAELDPWVQRMMELAIVTGQRRHDLGAMRFSDLQDGYLQVVQSKTGARLRLDLSLRLDVLGWSLADVIRRCRDAVVSPWLLHYARAHVSSKRGARVAIQTMSNVFARARAASGLTWSGPPPSLHEIRSLSARLYAEQGGVNVQSLLGHKNATMTAIYRDTRGTEWIDVAAMVSENK